jgi:hypothetical protein
MASPVWVLSVDLQAKTATFQSGMAEAAKSARSSFKDIGTASTESGRAVSESALNTRSAIGLIDNTIRGSHAAAMADLIREFKDSAVVMAALPFAVTIGGIAAVAAIAIEVAGKIKEWREEQIKLREEQTRFGTAVQETFNGLDSKILQAEQRADEFRNDHLGALGKELELINHQSFDELIHSFETIAKAADVVFGDLQSHWYKWGIGAAGAKHALEGFQTQYNSLLAQGKDKAASDLLAGTLAVANSTLAAQQQAKANSFVLTNNPTDSARVQKDFQEAYVKLKAAGVSYTDDEITAQKTLIKALETQETVQQRVATLKGLETGNASRSTSGEMSRISAEAAKQAADSSQRINESQITGDRAAANARLDIAHASIGQRLASDLEFADRELAVQLAGNQAQIAALDKYGKDYQDQLKALEDKTLEIQAAAAAKRAQIIAQAQSQQAAKDLRDLQQSEREKIGATQQASTERLAAIDAAIQEEQAHNLQAEDSYRGLLTQRVETVREMAEQEAQQRAVAGRIAADNDIKLAHIAIAAEQERQAVADSMRRMSDERKAAEETEAANAIYEVQLRAFDQQIAALDKHGKDYDNKLRELQNQQRQLTMSHETELTAIQSNATIARNQRILGALGQFDDSVARGLASVLTGHQTFASMMSGIGNQIAEGMLQNALKDMMTLDMTKEKEAAAAARQMFVAGTKFPFPANIVMAPALAASTFAAVMAYESGTDMVPGVGRGDIVPAMLEPGEGVVPGGVMDGLRNMVRSGNMGGDTTHIHLQYRPQIHAVDGASVEKMLDNHEQKFLKKFNSAVRRMNR